MKTKIYKFLSRANLGLFALTLTLVSGIAYSQTTYTFFYTGSTQTMALQPGTYTVEMWGADGGGTTGNNPDAGVPKLGGKGGYAMGTFSVAAPTTASIYVGGKGNTEGVNVPGGFNGGGNSGGGSGPSGVCGSGGGASDIRIGGNTLNDRIIVAGGGGAAGYQECNGSANVISGGHGGGLTGGAPVAGTYPARIGQGGTQTAGGAGGSDATYVAGNPGSFGQGGHGGTVNVTSGNGGGGGGGWYGGGAGSNGYYCAGGGGGGSSYIGGVTGGATYMFGQAGFITNPDATGNGHIRITQLCNINIYASTTNSLAPALCAGQSLTLTTDAASNISWNSGQSTNSIVVAPTTNTVYSVTGTSTMNCTAGAAISVTVSPGPPVLTVSNPSNNICLGQSATLTASGANSYSWTNGVVNSQSFTPTTTNSYTVTGENGCGTSSAVTTITVAPLQVNITANPTLVCEGYAATLTAMSSVQNYTWSQSSMTGSIITVAPMSTTIYSVLASDGICSGTATLSLPTKPTPSVTAVGTATEVCEGDGLNISASGAQTYVWTPDNVTGANIAVTPTASTLYQVAGTNSVGCTAYANWVVVVKAAPSGNASTNKALVCPGGPAVLSANGGTAYVWAGGPSTQTYSVNPGVPTVYTVDITGSNGCTATRTIGVNVYSPTVAITAGTTSLCDGESTILNSSPATSYTWNGTPGINFLAITPTVTTVYSLDATTFSTGVSCVATSSILITVNPNPEVSIVATKTVLCRNEPPAVLSGSGAVTYTWSNSATTATINSSNNVTTIYFVDGIDANGCSGTSEGFLVKVDPCTGVIENSANLENVFSVYPNPNNGSFTVKSDVTQNMILVNELGQIIQKFNLAEENNFQQEIRYLKPGIYFIMDQNTVSGNVQKIVVW